MKLTIKQLAQRIGAHLDGEGSAYISDVGPVAAASQTDVTFIAEGGHIAKLKESCAGAIIVAKRIEGLAKPQLIVNSVEAALIEALKIFAPKLTPAPEGVDSTARVADDAKIGKGVSIGPGVVIGHGAEIGPNTVIAGGCKIGQNSKIGEYCRFDSNVVIYHNCTIGNRVVIQANSTVGSTGFGYYLLDGTPRLIPHNGSVVIEDFVEIGANSCVDRAKFGETRIGAGTKIDNLVQIAHNVTIGKCCLMAGGVGIGGSAKIGNGVIFGGHSGVVDNVEIGDGTIVGAKSGVTHNVAAGQRLAGMPAYDYKKALKIISLTRRLPGLVEQLKQLSTRVAELEAAKDHKD